jgi:hypothetical protein
MARDVIRQIVVLVSAVIAVVGSFIGSGAAGGTPIQDAAGGALAADATPIAPGGPAFAIWSVIYVGLIAYAIWQLLPRQRSDPRQRLLGYPIAVTLILNAAWILSIQFGALALSVPIIVVLLVALIWTFFLTLRTRPSGVVEAAVADGTVGLYLGWVCVATAANITAFLVDAGFAGWGIPRDVWSVAIVAVAGAVGVLLAVRGRGRLAPAASLCWGLAWVAVARLTDAPHSVATGVAAIIAVVAVLATTIAIRVRAS